MIWGGISWRNDNKQEEGSNRYIQAEIMLQSKIIDERTLALGLTRPYENEKAMRTRGQILGELFTEDSRHLTAEGVRSCMMELLKILDRPTGELVNVRREPKTLQLRNNYWRGWTQRNAREWKQYHAPYSRTPNQKNFNQLIQQPRTTH